MSDIFTSAKLYSPDMQFTIKKCGSIGNLQDIPAELYVKKKSTLNSQKQSLCIVEQQSAQSSTSSQGFHQDQKTEIELAMRDMYFSLCEYLRRYSIKIQNSMSGDASRYNQQIAPLFGWKWLWTPLQQVGELIEARKQNNGKLPIVDVNGLRNDQRGQLQMRSTMNKGQQFNNEHFFGVIQNRIELLRKYINRLKSKEKPKASELQAIQLMGRTGMSHARQDGRLYSIRNNLKQAKQLLQESKTSSNQELTETLCKRILVCSAYAELGGNQLNQRTSQKDINESIGFQPDIFYASGQGLVDSPQASNLLDLIQFNNMQLLTVDERSFIEDSKYHIHRAAMNRQQYETPLPKVIERTADDENMQSQRRNANTSLRNSTELISDTFSKVKHDVGRNIIAQSSVEILQSNSGFVYPPLNNIRILDQSNGSNAQNVMKKQALSPDQRSFMIQKAVTRQQLIDSYQTYKPIRQFELPHKKNTHSSVDEMPQESVQERLQTVKYQACQMTQSNSFYHMRKPGIYSQQPTIAISTAQDIILQRPFYQTNMDGGQLFPKKGKKGISKTKTNSRCPNTLERDIK